MTNIKFNSAKCAGIAIVSIASPAPGSVWGKPAGLHGLGFI